MSRDRVERLAIVPTRGRSRAFARVLVAWDPDVAPGDIEGALTEATRDALAEVRNRQHAAGGQLELPYPEA